MKLGTLLSSLAKKAGVDTTQKEFVDLLATDVDIPDSIANKIDQGLMDIDAAKVHPDVLKKIKTETLNGIDAKISEILEEHGITDAEEVVKEKNTYEKIKKLAATIKTIEEKKAKSKGADKDQYEHTIKDLNQSLKELKEANTAKETEWKNTREGDLMNFELQKKLLGKNYNLPTDMDLELKTQTALTAVNRELQKKGFKIVRDQESGALKVLNKDGMPAYNDSNVPLEADSFIDGALAQNKLLKVNDQSQNGGGNNDVTIIHGDGKQGNMRVVGEIDQQLKELAQAQ